MKRESRNMIDRHRAARFVLMIGLTMLLGACSPIEPRPTEKSSAGNNAFNGQQNNGEQGGTDLDPQGHHENNDTDSSSSGSGNSSTEVKRTGPRSWPGIPSHPKELVFENLDFEPPVKEQYRRTLSNGTPVYLLPSREFPLVDITFLFKGGSYLDPTGKEGLADMTGALLRSGGTTSMSAEELDEKLDFMAVDCSSSADDDSCTVTMNTLTRNFDESFELFVDMVRNPGFQTDRAGLHKERVVEWMKQRNDNASAIRSREWAALTYGRSHHEARVATKASVESITTADLKGFHRRVFHPGNLIVGVTGDFDEAQVMAKLEKALGGWAKGRASEDPPQPDHDMQAGVFHVEKDIPQGTVFLGSRSIQRDHPDRIPLMVMNNILGGGGFTSRIMNKVRTEYGLSYSAGSRFDPGVWYPGQFRAYFGSKNLTVALAIKLILAEIDRIRTEPVSQGELDVAKASFVESFPQNFSSKSDILNVFMTDELTRRDQQFWKTFREKVSGVTVEDVQRVAKAHLDPSQLTVLVVGKWSEIESGNNDPENPHRSANMGEFFNGEVIHLPLLDPLTQEPMGP